MNIYSIQQSIKNIVPYHWLIVAVSAVGLSVCHAPILIYTFGFFLKPIIAEFGWQRGTVSSIMAVHSLTIVFAMPVAGYLIDRFGVRQVILPGILLFGIGVISLSALPAFFFIWVLVMVLLSFGAACSGPMPYSRVLIAWFNRRRGLSLGIAIAGVGVGSAVYPQVAQAVISSDGWRAAFIVLGGIVVLFGFPLVWLFLRNTPEELGMGPDGEKSQNAQAKEARLRSGLTVNEAMKTRDFWLFGCAFVLAAIPITGMTLHLVPIITDKGVSVEVAALTLAVFGISTTVGRIGVGWLLDRFFAPYVAIVFFLPPCLAALLLAGDVSNMTGFICAFSLGLGMGAEFDVIAYVTSRYFGQRSFAVLYGYFFSAFSVGAAIGPVLLGVGYDLSGTYTQSLMVSSILILGSCVLLKFVGSYPEKNI